MARSNQYISLTGELERFIATLEAGTLLESEQKLAEKFGVTSSYQQAIDHHIAHQYPSREFLNLFTQITFTKFFIILPFTFISVSVAIIIVS